MATKEELIAQIRKIPLTQDQFTIVDDEDFDWLRQWRWYAQWNKNIHSFYAVRNSKAKNGEQRQISMSRKILGLQYGDKRQSDHTDHNTLDNRRLNLRIVTNSQNQFNKKKPHKGYYWHKASQKYLAKIGLNGKTIALGLFRTAKDAHNAYLQAKKQYHNL